MANQKPLEEIRLDIENKFNMAVAEMAEEISWQIESAYESVIQSFYDDYTPRWYQRTLSTYEASDHSDNPFKTKPIDGGFESGIIVDPSFIKGKPYRADTAWVFDRTFGKGIHGYFKWEMKQWAPQIWKNTNQKYVLSKARKNKLREFLRKSFLHAPKKYRHGTNMALMTSNAGTKFSDMRVVRLKGFSSTPKRGMDAAFRKITQKKNMDAIFSSIFEGYFSE